jgi:hypothetical protein
VLDVELISTKCWSVADVMSTSSAMNDALSAHSVLIGRIRERKFLKTMDSLVVRIALYHLMLREVTE